MTQPTTAPSTFEDPDAIWRRCEVAWSEWLDRKGYPVVRLGEAIGNTSSSAAPLITVQGANRRAPDLQTTVDGRSEFWEIKYRTRSDVDPQTGSHEHWMGYAAFRDYVAVSDGTGSPVQVAL